MSMLVVLSPAKSLDFEKHCSVPICTLPQFAVEAEQLVKILRSMTPLVLSELMSISEKLGVLNAKRYSDWSPHPTQLNACPALLAFNGDVYEGFSAQTLDDEGLVFAQKTIRILSGLYGILRPLDLMQPYRLEMGTKLHTPMGNDLYAYWNGIIASALNHELDKREPILINLASDEYFKSINTKVLNARVIKPIFEDYKNGQYKVISFFAKKARGLMARFIVDHRMTHADELKQFNLAGYFFASEESSENIWVFRRKEI
jgi:cytoplasmic iron level regulating protein YaaA (DUF328/UPF0246 family)